MVKIDISVKVSVTLMKKLFENGCICKKYLSVLMQGHPINRD